MAAKQTTEDLDMNRQADEYAARALHQPAGITVTPSQQSTVSQDLFSSASSFTAIDLALHELLSTIEEATQIRKRADVRPRLLQSHITALREDAEMVASFQTPDEQLRTKVTQAVLQARKLRRQLERDIIDHEIENETESRGAQQQVQLIQLDATKSSSVKLAPLKLPTFNGDATQFSVYREFFEENILNNEQLTDTAKWLRLTESLTGPPAELLSELPHTSQTLTIAWKLLLETFSADDRPIAALYAKLQQLPQATMHTASLKMTHSKLEGVLLTLEHLGHDVGENGYVRWLYMGKFPIEVAYQVQKKRNVPLAELRVAVGDLIRAREGADQQSGAYTFVAPPVVSKRSTATTQRAVGAEQPTQKKSAPSSIRVCAFCGADHWNDTCSTYTTIEARKQRLAGKCFRCLRRVHEGACVNPRRCFHCDAVDHNRALCPTKFAGQKAESGAVVQAAAVEKEDSTGTRGFFLAFVARATSQQIQQPIEIRVVVDTGGGATILRKEIAERLQIPAEKSAGTSYAGLGGAQLIRSRPLLAPIFLEDRAGNAVEIQAEMVDWIIPEIPTADVDKFRKRHPQFCGTYIPPTGHGRPVDLLIGSDMVVELLLPEPICRVDEDTCLMPTIFGSLILGRERERNTKVRHFFLFNAQTNPLHQMCTLDVIGLTDLHNGDIDEEEKAIKYFYDTVKFIDQRYSISWPWRTDPPNLDTNFGLALGRLKTLHRKLKNSPQLLLEYDKIIHKQLDADIIEVTTNIKTQSRIVHYLPHHPVLQPEKEVRLVYDGSSKSGKTRKSLNDNILKGKNWLNDLFKTLLRFRRYPNVCISDIAKAFHQIAINEEDRNAVRFLWLKNPLQPPTDENLEFFRFKRVAFGIVASPFILSATIQYHANKQTPNENLNILLQDMYADNLVSALPEAIDTCQFYDYAKTFFTSMSMNLTKWATNDKRLRGHIPETDYAPEVVQSVLGLRWNTEEDTFRFKQPKLQHQKLLTRRTVAREMASYFDPLGWATPVLLLAKSFFRKVWAATEKWDATLQAVHIQEWTEISQKLKQINLIVLPRQMSVFAGEQTFQIHTFVDASATAYAVAVYLRVQQGAAVELSMIAAKSRLTPTRTVTIPRLELIAILLGCRFTHFIQETLQFPNVTTFIWSDSKCALGWMQQKKILPSAIEKYITEAKAYKIDEFRHVPGEKNFADVATRGADVHTLQQMRWWTGPEWLYHDEDWPKNVESENIEQQPLLLLQAELVNKIQPHKEGEVTGIAGLDIRKFSVLLRLLVRTAYLLKAVVRLLRSNFLGLQTALDTACALKLWLRWDQARQYALNGEIGEGRRTLLRGVAVFRDEDGIIRCQTRIRNSCFNLDAATPILLVQNSTLTKLIILQTHTQQMHAGTNHTLAVLRQKYWLPHGRRQVYKVIANECFTCKKFRAKAYPAPPPAPLPEFRVLRVQKPFQAVGVDVFGPFYVRQPSAESLRKEKRWVLIFTCATVRAVHLEVIVEMTTVEFNYAFRRFFARRGVPRKFISDNAPQFHALDNHFRNLWQTIAKAPAISNYFAEHQIVWDFTPELAPWMGSIYERLIQSIKKSLEKTYADKVLTSRQFELAITETEAVINSRPIAYMDRDPECPILTPNDFLSVTFSAIPLQTSPEEGDTHLAKLWRSSQEYLDQFWNHWASQYVMLLRERNDQLKQRRSHANRVPEKGDIVVMQDLSKKRSAWQLAVVERMAHSSDGQVRTVQIRVPNGARFIRPIVQLAPLGIKMDLPAVKDEQLNKRRDAIVVWPIEDIPTEKLDEVSVNTDGEQAGEPERSAGLIVSGGLADVTGDPNSSVAKVL